MVNGRAFTKLISNLPYNSHSLKKREIVTGKCISRVTKSTYHVVSSSNYSNGSIVGKVLVRLIGAYASFKKRTLTPLFTFQLLPKRWLR